MQKQLKRVRVLGWSSEFRLARQIMGKLFTGSPIILALVAAAMMTLICNSAAFSQDTGNADESQVNAPSALVYHTLKIAVTGAGSVRPAVGVHRYPQGAIVSVTAIPANGKKFTGWSGAATGKENPVKIPMGSNKTLTAHFTGAATYTLKTAVKGQGSIRPAPGPHKYAAGTVVSVKATPKNGATFTGWSGAASGKTNPLKIRMNANKVVTANFTGTGATTYTLKTAVTGNGSVRPAAGTHTYAAGTIVSVRATPASGATFTGWSGAASGIANPVRIRMNANKTVTANFTGGGSVTYSLNIAVSGNGSTSPAAGAHTYAAGSTVSVTATPDSGATFTGWSGAASGTTNPVTITMNGDKALTARFSGSVGACETNCATDPAGACSSPKVRISEVEVGVPVVNNESETGLKPLAITAIPTGGSWLAWMSNNGRVYVGQLDCNDQLIGTPFSFAANDFQDIDADEDGGVLLLTRNAQGGGTLNCGNPSNLCDSGPNPAIPCYGMYMVRFTCTGDEQWATQLTTQSAQLPPYSTGKNGPAVHMIWWYQHHGRLAWDGTNHAAYFCEALSVSQNGCINIHEGDRMKVVDPNGKLQSGHDSFDWGCSHSWNTRIVWDETTRHFAMICATDRGGGIAQPDNPGHLIYNAKNLATLGVGDIVPAKDGGYWITASDQGSVQLMHFNNGAVDKTFALGQSPHSKLETYGSGMMVAGWGSGSAITAVVLDTASGQEIGSAFTINVPNNIYQAFKPYPDGSVAYAAPGTSNTKIRIARILPCIK
jgi:hypothetical protein